MLLPLLVGEGLGLLDDLLLNLVLARDLGLLLLIAIGLGLLALEVGSVDRKLNRLLVLLLLLAPHLSFLLGAGNLLFGSRSWYLGGGLCFFLRSRSFWLGCRFWLWFRSRGLLFLLILFLFRDSLGQSGGSGRRCGFSCRRVLFLILAKHLSHDVVEVLVGRGHWSLGLDLSQALSWGSLDGFLGGSLCCGLGRLLLWNGSSLFGEGNLLGLSVLDEGVDHVLGNAELAGRALAQVPLVCTQLLAGLHLDRLSVLVRGCEAEEQQECETQTFESHLNIIII